MEQISQYMTAKQNDKGYTLLSMLVVISILSILGLFGMQRISESYETMALQKQMELLMSLAMRAKYDAYLLKETRTLTVNPSFIEYDGITYENYGKVVADGTYSISYNENGNIRQACSVGYSNKTEERYIVFWIGGGYFEEKE